MRLLSQEERAAGVDREGLVEVLGRDVLERHGLDEPGAGDDDVEPALLGPDRRKETIEIVQVGQIALHRGHLVTDCRDRLVQLGLPPAGDEHVAALRHEPLRDRQADPAAAAGDHRDLAVKSHRELPSRLRRIWSLDFMVGLPLCDYLSPPLS